MPVRVKICSHYLRYAVDSNRFIRVCQRHMGAPDRVIIRRPLKLTFFKFFRPTKRLANIFEGGSR